MNDKISWSGRIGSVLFAMIIGSFLVFSSGCDSNSSGSAVEYSIDGDWRESDDASEDGSQVLFRIERDATGDNRLVGLWLKATLIGQTSLHPIEKTIIGNYDIENYKVEFYYAEGTFSGRFNIELIGETVGVLRWSLFDSSCLASHEIVITVEK